MSLTAPAMARKAIAAALGVTILHLTSENARPFLRIVVSRSSSPEQSPPERGRGVLGELGLAARQGGRPLI